MWMCIALCGVLASATGVLSQQQLTLAKLISTNPSLSQLRDLIAANNSDLLDVTLESPAPMLTVFAPNNQAMQALARDHPGIVTNITAVRNILLNHILVNVTVKSSEIKSNLRVFSALNGPLWFHKTKEGVTVNEARVILPDQMASNGVVHVIGAVLYPFGVLSSVGEIVITEPDYSRLKPFVDRAPEVRDILFNRSRLVTVFAPTNDVLPIADAFGDTDLEAMLKRHICAENVLFAEYFGGDRRLETYHGDTLTKKMDNNVYVMNSNDLWSRVVSSGGVPTLNGAVHRINGVLGLSSGVNLVEALGLNGLTYLRHKIVFEQLDKALVELSENYTIFAPSNAAFDHFTAPEGEAMSTILRRHVIKGIVLSGEIQAEQTMQTLNREETVTVTKVQGKVYVDFQGTKATVISANKRAANGVIHFIDTVLSTAPTTSAPAVFLISSLLMILLLL